MYKGKNTVKVETFFFISFETLERFLNSSECNVLEILRLEKQTDGHRVIYLAER